MSNLIANLTSSTKPTFTPSQNHGYLLKDSKLDPPTVSFQSNTKARPGYDSTEYSSSEYSDNPIVLRTKVKLLAEAIKSAAYPICYAGAGLSTSSGIADYASSNDETTTIKYPKNGIVSPMDATPSSAHFVLKFLADNDYLKFLVNQNHDSLPQKAGFPGNKICDIHGSLYDPSNPIIKMEGQLRTDLYQQMEELGKKADFCLILGTSLAGMNADQVVHNVCSLGIRKKQAGGVMINIQRTRHDANMGIRIFAKIDQVMILLAEELGLLTNQARDYITAYNPRYTLPISINLPEDVFNVCVTTEGVIVPKDSKLCTRLDLSEGAFVVITQGQFAGDCGEVVGKNRFGHFRVRFVHKLTETRKAFFERTVGAWHIKDVLIGEEDKIDCENDSVGVFFPIVNVDEKFAQERMRMKAWGV